MQYCKDEPAINAPNGKIVDFDAGNATTDLLKIKEKITGNTGNDSTENIEIMVPLKYLSNFWKTFEMLLTNCK